MSYNPLPKLDISFLLALLFHLLIFALWILALEAQESSVHVPIQAMQARILEVRPELASSSPVVETKPVAVEAVKSSSPTSQAVARRNWLKKVALAQKKKVTETVAEAQINPVAALASLPNVTTEQQATIAKIQQAIIEKIRQNWIPSITTTAFSSCTLRVHLNAHGAVTAANSIAPCHANAAFKRSVLNAIRRASPLPVPADQALFENYFKIFIFTFDSK
jgi:colicin import membrane protein